MVAIPQQDDSSARSRYHSTVSREKSLIVDRYRLLLKKVRGDFVSEHGHDHGWIQHAALQLGRHRSMISAVWQGTKGIGAKSAEKAAEQYNLPPAFFMDAKFDAEGFLSGRVIAESHVEPLVTTPVEQVFQDFEKRFSENYRASTLDMLRVSAFARDGKLTLGELIDAAEEIEQMHTRRLGPPVLG